VASEFVSHRRFYLSKRIVHRLNGEFALSALRQAKQEAEPGGTALPATFPHYAALAQVGYVASEDLVGADECELVEWVGITTREATAVLAAAAAL
jgi:hypothetical protein